MSPYQDKLYTKQFTLQKMEFKKKILQTTISVNFCEQETLFRILK